jgi:8-hydroxy-5-deazaflavin:NADPH oxidoreductase
MLVKNMKIAILGAGNVGGTLGKRFAECGHEIYFGVPNPEKYKAENLPGKIGKVSQAAKDAEIILLAVPYNAIDEAVKECGDVAGKIIIDATNPLGMTPDGLNLIVGFETSGAEKLQQIAVGAKVVKCFNQTGFNVMANPNHSMMFVCGDDAGANETVRQLAAEIGFDAVTIGVLSKARLLEPLAMLWIHLSISSDLKRNFAFSIQK